VQVYLCIALAAFQKLMGTLLAGLAQYKKCFLYLDDILVVQRNFKEHLQFVVSFWMAKESWATFETSKV